MKQLVLFSLVLFSTSVFGQSSVIVYSPEGKKFTASLNGVQENEQPQANVAMHNLQPSRYALIVELEESGQKIDKSLYLEDNMEYKLEIRDKNQSGISKGFRKVNSFLTDDVDEDDEKDQPEVEPEYVLRLVSQRELAPAPPPSHSTSQTTTTTTTSPGSGDGSVNVSMNVNMSENSASSNTQQSTNQPGSRQSTVSAPGPGGEVSARVDGQSIVLGDGRVLKYKFTGIKGMVGSEVEMKVPVGAKVSISYDGEETYSSEVPFYYREKDYRKYSSYFKIKVAETNGTTWSVKLQHRKNNRMLIDEIVGGGTTTTTTTTATTTTSSGGCNSPMNSSAFNDAKESIGSKTFSDSKMQIARQVTGSNCLSAEQVKQVMMLFTYEEDRLEFAKFAYPHTFDKGNYYKINDAFEFEMSIDELNEWMQKQ